MRRLVSFFFRSFLAWLPPTRFYGLKRALYRLTGAEVADKVRIVSSVRILTTGSVVIGADTFIGHECLIVGGDAPIKIGSNCDLGPRVMIVTGTHCIDTEGPRVAGEGFSLPITIGEGCWICAGATILGGTHIGSRSIVAAGAVVKGDFPSGVLIGGIPARVLKERLKNPGEKNDGI